MVPAIIIVYLAIGIGVMLWIKRDNELRLYQGVDVFAFTSILLWPIIGPLWIFLRPPERVEDRVAQKSYKDFQNFMKSRKTGEGDLLSGLDERSKAVKTTVEINEDEQIFKDLHIEQLIDKKEYMEALRTANDMLRFAREQQEHNRVVAYQRYIIDIKDKRAKDFHKS